MLLTEKLALTEQEPPPVTVTLVTPGFKFVAVVCVFDVTLPGVGAHVTV